MTAQNVLAFYGRGITSRFGDSRDGGRRRHRGTDWSHSSQSGTGVPALLDGVVIGRRSPGAGHGFGYQVTIRSVLDGVTVDFSYAHGDRASQYGMGARVRQGDIVMTEGRTGNTTGPCVHVELFRNGGYVDPLPYVRRVLEGAGGGSAPAGGGVPFNAHDLMIQQKLNAIGWSPRLTEDGKRGSSTIANVKAFQRAYGLAVDGIPGPQTTAVLQSEYHRLVEMAQPATSDPSTWDWGGIQEMLQSDFGYTAGVDGKAGKGTWSAMQRFLKKYGYAGAIDGIPGGGTLAALAAWLRARYGYVGNNVPGPAMKAAFDRAAYANAVAYPKR